MATKQQQKNKNNSKLLLYMTAPLFLFHMELVILHFIIATSNNL